MTISRKAADYLEQLLKTGLYGQTIEEAMARLVDERLRQLITEGFLLREEIGLAPSGAGKCPRCGSPNLTNLSGMGSSEWECRDCEHRFTP